MQKAITYVGMCILCKERYILIRNPQEDTPQRLLLRIHEVAETLGIGRTNIYELIATGVLPTLRVGRAVRISDIALQK